MLGRPAIHSNWRAYQSLDAATMAFVECALSIGRSSGEEAFATALLLPDRKGGDWRRECEAYRLCPLANGQRRLGVTVQQILEHRPALRKCLRQWHAGLHTEIAIV